MFKGSVVAVTLALLVGAGQAQASIQYRLSGVVPDGASSHSEVSAGETWTATFLIDETTPAGPNDFPNASSYHNAVLSGTLEFSGGYVSPFDFSSGYDVVVFNEATAGFDALFIRETATNAGIRFQAVTIEDAFSSTALPLSGAGIDPSPDFVATGFIQLAYSDSLGSIFYDTSSVNNVTFGVVPEPTTLLVWGGLGLCSCLVWRRSRAA